MTKIFISHSSKDTEFAKQLAKALAEIGIDVWIDVDSIRAGEKWNNAIQRGLKTCEAMIVIITPDSMASDNVNDEWLYYHQRRKKIFTVLWEPTDDIHFQLEPIQYVNFHGQGFADAFGRLRVELQQQGIAVNGAEGEMHEIRSDDVIPPQPLDLPEMDVEDILPPPFEWCEIPAGKVTLEAGGYLKQLTTFDTPVFAIARYPITNAQYQAFANAEDGFVELKWWDYSKAAQEYRDSHWHPMERAFLEDDHPRVNVVWYEVVAFCNWLAAKTHMQITLPTEQQWQWAAIGDTGRTYPWGREFENSRCNSGESGIGRTTPVTQYPQGVSPHGVLDMSGNIWEWCLNDWETGDTDISKRVEFRTVRGGSWVDKRDTVRAFSRGCIRPHIPDRNHGFRIVAVSLATL